MKSASDPQDKEPMELSLSSPLPPAKRRSPWLPLAVLLAAFLTGFTPMWIKSIRLNAQLNRAEVALRLESLQLTLATAALDARRGDYEPARQGMASFFNLLSAELDRITGSALPASSRADVQPLLAQRDDLITLLARGDPASAERLARASAAFKSALGK